MKRVLAIILGGGAGTRLYPLTKTRAKPAVPLAGKYRLIDIPVSNCINSEINKIYVLTQFNSASLNRHLTMSYNLSAGFGQGFVEVLAAQQTPDSPSWFEGTADAVRKYQWLFQEWDVDHYLILSGDQLYRMDYSKFVQHHIDTGAQLSVGALPVDAEQAEGFGLMRTTPDGRIREFREKPKGEAQPNPAFSFYDEKFPIYTRPRYLPPSKLQDAQVTESIIGEGSLLKACSIHHCVLGVRSRVEDEVVLQDTLVMGADYFESSEERLVLRERGGIPIGVGKGTTVKRAILDKNVRIGKDVTIVNKDHVEEADRPELNFYIRNGIVVVVKNGTIADGTVI
jgi:ADP-glucose pyrophosphorylase